MADENTPPFSPQKRGFAAIPTEKLREIASAGGKDRKHLLDLVRQRKGPAGQRKDLPPTGAN